MSRIRGKVASYWLNAVVDMQIARHLTDFVRDGIEPPDDTEAGQRARHLMQVTRHDEHYEDRLIMLAYCEERCNGMADIVLADFYNRVLGLDVIQEHAYDPDELRFRYHFAGWFGLAWRNMRPMQAYAEQQTGRRMSIPPREAVREIIRVQQQNILANEKNKTNIRLDSDAATDTKVGRLVALAHQSDDAAGFIKGAANTQSAAAYWDRLYVAAVGWSYLLFKP